jgi:glutamine synthetase
MSLTKLTDLIKKHQIKFIDFRFIDLPGFGEVMNYVTYKTHGSYKKTPD